MIRHSYSWKTHVCFFNHAGSLAPRESIARLYVCVCLCSRPVYLAHGCNVPQLRTPKPTNRPVAARIRFCCLIYTQRFNSQTLLSARIIWCLCKRICVSYLFLCVLFNYNRHHGVLIKISVCVLKKTRPHAVSTKSNN